MNRFEEFPDRGPKSRSLNSDFIYPAEFKNNVPYIIDFILESSDTDITDKELVNSNIGNRYLDYQETVIHGQ